LKEKPPNELLDTGCKRRWPAEHSCLS